MKAPATGRTSLRDGALGAGAVGGTWKLRAPGEQDAARFDGIALHDDFAVGEDVRIHHLVSDHVDDNLVLVDDAGPGGSGEGEVVRDGGGDFRRVHRIDEPGASISGAVVHVVMARCGREEEAMADGQVLVGKGEAYVDGFANCGLVRFVEDEGFALHGPVGELELNFAE